MPEQVHPFRWQLPPHVDIQCNRQTPVRILQPRAQNVATAGEHPGDRSIDLSFIGQVFRLQVDRKNHPGVSMLDYSSVIEGILNIMWEMLLIVASVTAIPSSRETRGCQPRTLRISESSQ